MTGRRRPNDVSDAKGGGTAEEPAGRMDGEGPAFLFDTIAAGGGHVATARAMRDAVARVSGGRAGGPVRDAMLALGLEAQDLRHKRAWSRLLRTPRLVRSGQRLLDAVPRVVHAVQVRLLDELARRIAADPVAAEVDLVVVNHGFLMVAYARARTSYGLRVPVVTFATEPFDASALWSEPDAERVIAPSHEARRDLIRLGVPAASIDVVGYPVAGEVLSVPSRREARERLGLVGDRWALFSLGGEGVVARPLDWVRALLDAGWRVMAIAGRNRPLERALGSLGVPADRLHVHGFVDDMALRLAAADAVVGKAGPASTMEALAVGRPLLITSHAGLNERAIVDYLEESRLGRRVSRPGDLAAALGGADLALGTRGAPAPDFRAMADDLGRHLLDLAAGTAAPAPLGLDRDPWHRSGADGVRGA